MVLCVENIIALAYVDFGLAFMTATYIIRSKHIVAQLEFISEIIPSIDVAEVVELHADAILQVNSLAKVFTTPMML